MAKLPDSTLISEREYFWLFWLKLEHFLERTDCNNGMKIRVVFRKLRIREDYQTFYQNSVVRNQWSTFDVFDVMDCSQIGEKWHYFTSQVYLNVTVLWL